MMGTLIAAVVVVVALIVLLVLKKRKRGPKKEKGTAVPISDPQEIRALKKSFAAAPKGKLTNSQLIQMAQQERGPMAAPLTGRLTTTEKVSEQENESKLRLAPDLLKAEAAPQATKPAVETKPAVQPSDMIAENLKAAKWQKAQETIERLEQENKRLKEALERGADQPKETQSKSAAPGPGVQEMTAENSDLKHKIEEERSRYDELEKKFNLFKGEFDHLKSLEWAKEEALQGQILKLKEENEALSRTKEAMERRKAEFEALQEASRKKEADLQKLHDELNGIKKDYMALQEEYKQSQQKALKLKEDMEVAKLTLEQQLSDATDRLMSLQQARENAKENELSAEERGVLAQLREENEKLSATSESLKQEFAKIKGMNEQLREREKILQYELTKSRAQSIGLEKICEDFKEQIETMNKVANEN